MNKHDREKKSKKVSKEEKKRLDEVAKEFNLNYASGKYSLSEDAESQKSKDFDLPQGKEGKENNSAAKEKSGMNNPPVKEKSGMNDPAVWTVEDRKVVCKNCRARVVPVNDVCPECGHYINEGGVTYQPISKKTARTIRWIVTAVLAAVIFLLVIFDVWYLPSCDQMTNSAGKAEAAMCEAFGGNVGGFFAG
jgi:hypothetical protein